MKILVPMKRVADPANANKVKVADGKSVQHDGLEWVMNPFDEWALETALRMTENAADKTRVGQITLVSVGPDAAVETLRKALGKGAEKAILVKADDAELDGDIIAHVLHQVAGKEAPDLIVMGKQAADGDSNVVGTKLAELLGWPCVNYVTAVETTDGGKTLKLTRELDTGVQTLTVTGPAVITCSDRILKPGTVKNGVTPASFEYKDLGDLNSRIANVKQVMAANKVEPERYSLSDLGVESKRTDEYVRFALPEGKKGKVVFVASVDELVEKLKTEAKVL